MYGCTVICNGIHYYVTQDFGKPVHSTRMRKRCPSMRQDKLNGDAMLFTCNVRLITWRHAPLDTFESRSQRLQ